LCENRRVLSNPKLLSPAEVAELLGVHRASVYRRINSGGLPAIRLGEDGPLRIRSDRLEDWLAATAVPKGEETNERV
jgi:excisionase family DNA binding protein